MNSGFVWDSDRWEWVLQPEVEDTQELRTIAPRDMRDEYAHGDDACDQAQERPDLWQGVQRDPDMLPVGGAAGDG